jgi:hypothetical protein
MTMAACRAFVLACAITFGFFYVLSMTGAASANGGNASMAVPLFGP